MSAVADRSLVTLSEVDRLKTVLRDLSAAAFEAEYRLSAKIQHSVLTEISTLEQQLAEAKGRYSSYVGEMKDTMFHAVSQASTHAFTESPADLSHFRA